MTRPPSPLHKNPTLACLTGGIKLHLELSLLLGTAAEACLQWGVSFYTWSWPWLGPAALLTQAAAAAVGGASRGCVAAADILLVLLWPLVVLFVLCAHVHRLQLRCLAATWRLIRGKQQVCRDNMVVVVVGWGWGGRGRVCAPSAVSTDYRLWSSAEAAAVVTAQAPPHSVASCRPSSGLQLPQCTGTPCFTQR